MSNFNYYQERAHETSANDTEQSFTYPVLGLCSEAGEIADKFKKLWRDRSIREWDQIPSDDRAKILKELGDALWYIAEITTRLGHKLTTVAEINLAKLDSRAKRGKIHGSGDNR